MSVTTKIKNLFGTEAGSKSEPQVRHDERRRHRRIQHIKLTIIIDGRRYKTKDWSLGGFRIHAADMNVLTNDNLSGEIRGPGMFDRGDFEACVAWTAESGELGARFTEISGETARAMATVQK